MKFSKYTLNRNDKASQILLKNDRDREPFILYLRKFDINVLHGKVEQEERLFLEEQVFNYLPSNINLITTSWESDDIMRKGESDKIPTIILGEDWKPFIEALIIRAELIIIEIPMMAKGLIWELDTIIRLNKNHNTVLILPPLDAIFPPVDHEKPLDQFPRVIWADQLHQESIIDNFVIKDLLTRISDIAKIDKDQRIEVYTNANKLNKLLPITYKGVLKGYLKRINEWKAIILWDDGKSSYYKFWDHFRVGSIIGIHLEILGDENKNYLYRELANAYIKIIQFLLEFPGYLNRENSYVTLNMLKNMVNSIKPILNKIENPDWWLVSEADKVIDRANQMFTE